MIVIYFSLIIFLIEFFHLSNLIPIFFIVTYFFWNNYEIVIIIILISSSFDFFIC